MNAQQNPAPTVDEGPAPTLQVVSAKTYRGANLWSYRQAMHFVVDLGVLEQYPSSAIDGFTDRLLEMVPGLHEHGCSLGRKGGFVERLHDGTWMGHIAEHVSLELQNLAGHRVTRGKTRSVPGHPGRYNMIFAYQEERVGRAAGEFAVRIVNHSVDPQAAPLDFSAELDDFLRLAQRTAFGPSTQAIIEEAESRDIPWIRLNQHSFVQLGQGVHAQRIRATMTSRTSALAVDVAGDKSMTTALLSGAGLPVPRSATTRDKEAAVELAESIGYPVVVKPLDGNHGRGVCLNLQDADEVREGFDTALAQSRRGIVVVESYVVGKDYRFLVIGGKLAAVAERVPAQVVGDGTSTVRELVDLANQDPRRGVGHEKVLTRIALDAAAEAYLAEQGHSPESVPAAGEAVPLVRTGNMSTGGISIDRTWEAHPDNIEIAEEAARIVGLDIAGIDFMCPDITQSVSEVGGAIVEVNAAPGFRMHTHPTEGEPQFIAKPVLDLLFPPGSPARVPIVAVTGTNGKTTTSRMVGHIMRGSGRHVGMTSTDGVAINERLVIRRDASGPKSARTVLQHPRVDFAVMEVARGGIIREGLGYDKNDVAVVTNVTADHLGLGGVDTVEQLAEIKSVIVSAVPRSGYAVLNADDPLVRQMRNRCRGQVVWFSMAEPGSAERAFVEKRLLRGGLAVLLEQTERGERIVLAEGKRWMPLTWTHTIPATYGGAARFNVANAMAAAGAAWCSGAPLHDIRAGLRSFAPDYYLSPGRLNRVDVNGAEVYVDYAHNPAGIEALGQFVVNRAAQLGEDDQAPQRIGVVGAAGDRRDDDIRELGRIAARYFDHLVVREDKNLRRRPAGESARLVLEGAREVAEAEGLAVTLHEQPDEQEACKLALGLAEPGDVVALAVDQHAEVMRGLEEFTHRAHPAPKDAGLMVADPDLS
ncbi:MULTISPECIES: cyanophycin synthetase [Kytococcus]|uniref:Cyanophycin synthetase n=1 Tax=Kytococcus schroeteri TaxID=138300 RepID=A0A2I1PDY2_9MICO|nr:MULTISPECIES: cyanophycin synthetase [Kytococcus]OFS14124.1 cyanophycin synthetase [Kytococcus sp. HMSC28H12]PKZ42837.1 cyanophycin synthetase [Kytococcus schroeteri]